MATWRQPKTDWTPQSGGVTDADFNRIEENTEYLHDEQEAHDQATAVHGATSAATANRIVIRDASGRAKVAAPSASDDIARKAEVDAKPSLGETSSTAYRGDRGKTAYDHVSKTDNPHNVTAAQVGLGSVENYPIASKAEAEAGSAGNKYMTPERTKQAIDELAPSSKRTSRFVIGTSTAGWTGDDADYLCDGTADQVEINAAITALPAGGGEIVILDGTYNIEAKIKVNKNNVKIRGNGNATILKRMYNSSPIDGVITVVSVSNCAVVSLQIDGNRATYTSISNNGIYLNSSSNTTVTGNTCNNNNCGIDLTSSSNNTVTGNTCNNNNNSGILLTLSSNNNVVVGNTSNNNNDYGIYLSSPNNNNVVVGNQTSGNDTGINDKGTGNVVESNKT